MCPALPHSANLSPPRNPCPRDSRARDSATARLKLTAPLPLTLGSSAHQLGHSASHGTRLLAASRPSKSHPAVQSLPAGGLPHRRTQQPAARVQVLLHEQDEFAEHPRRRAARQKFPRSHRGETLSLEHARAHSMHVRMCTCFVHSFEHRLRRGGARAHTVLCTHIAVSFRCSSTREARQGLPHSFFS